MTDMFSDFVHVAGGALVDAHGEPLILRGVGLGNWLLPEGYMWKFEDTGPQSPRQIEAMIDDLVGGVRANEFWRRFTRLFINEDDITQIRAEGLNHVRVAMNSRLLIADDGTLLEDGFSTVDELIQWCRRNELWAVLDLHGAPGGQTGTNIDDSPRGVPELFTDGHYRALTITLWEALAHRYREETAVAAYDLLNEPLPNQYQHRYAQELTDLYVDLTAAIRQIDPHHVITYEGSHWATNWSMFTKVWDSNSLLQFHKYWSPPDKPSIQRFIDIGRDLGLPIYMGEGGENSLQWLQTAFQLYEDCNISWNFWPWKKIDTLTSPCSVTPPIGWHEIVSYAAGHGPRPAADDAWDTLDALLDAMPLSRCVYRSEVMSALLRRPPLEIPATGFSFRGPGESYSVLAGSSAAGFRLDERVKIRVAPDADPDDLDFTRIGGAKQDLSEGYAVQLDATEWVSYDINLTAPTRVQVTITLEQSRPDTGPPAVSIDIDGAPFRPNTLQDTTTVIATTPKLNAGTHRLRLTGTSAETLVRKLDVAPI